MIQTEVQSSSQRFYDKDQWGLCLDLVQHPQSVSLFPSYWLCDDYKINGWYNSINLCVKWLSPQLRSARREWLNKFTIKRLDERLLTNCCNINQPTGIWHSTEILHSNRLTANSPCSRTQCHLNGMQIFPFPSLNRTSNMGVILSMYWPLF